MSKFILGIDGGATKSHLVMFDSGGKCVAATSYGPLSHEVMEGSYAELKERLGEFSLRVISEAGASLKDIEHAVFGLAGVDSDGQQAIISNIVREIGFENATVCNDAFLGVAGACPDCVGICAINGTGFKFAAIDHSGKAVHTCGLSGLTDDLGGGNWYGTSACCAVYNEMYRYNRPSTIMREMLFNLLELKDTEDFMEVLTEKVYNQNKNLDRVALNSIVFDAAEQGDTVATTILDRSAEAYADAISWLALNLDFPKNKTVHISLAGSVFVRQKVKVLHGLIEKRVKTALSGRDVNFILMDSPPVVGAAVWAAQKAGFNLDVDAIKVATAKL